MVTLEAPPTTNRGVQIRRGQIDWLEGSIRGLSVEEVQRLVTADIDGEWAELEHGASGYASASRSRAGAMVMHDSRRPEIHFRLTGTVLQTWERVELQAACAFLLARGATFSRVDSCMDVPYDVATVEDFREAWKEGIAVTHARKSRYIEDDSRDVDAATVGRTWYLGAVSSDRALRVYDKGAEDPTMPGLTRIELQERDEAGTEAVRQFVGAEYGSYFAARLLSFVDFREGQQVNVSERARSLWYVALVGACAAAEAYPPKEARTVAEMVAWVERAVAPLLAALVTGQHVDVHELLYAGARRWKSRHEQIAGVPAWST